MSDNDFSATPAPLGPGWPARLRAAAGALAPWGLGAVVLALGGGAWWWARASYLQRFGSLDGGGAATDAARAAWGQFGDFMGGVVNPLLTLLTLLALVATVALQWRQLQTSRAELEATRDELKKTVRAQQDAADAMKGQLEQARLTAQAQQQAANALHAAAQLQSQLVQVTSKQGEVAESAANAQWRAAQIAGLSEGIRLAQHHLANMPTIPNAAPRLLEEVERISWLEIQARKNFWNLFETVIDGTRTEREKALD